MEVCSVICGVLAVAFGIISIVSMICSLDGIRRQVFDVEKRLEQRIIRLEREKDLVQ